MLFLLGAINFDGDEIVAKDDLWNLNSDGSLGNDWGGGKTTNETGVESSTEAESSIVATESSTKSTKVVMIRVI